MMPLRRRELGRDADAGPFLLLSQKRTLGERKATGAEPSLAHLTYEAGRRNE